MALPRPFVSSSLLIRRCNELKSQLDLAILKKNKVVISCPDPTV